MSVDFLLLCCIRFAFDCSTESEFHVAFWLRYSPGGAHSLVCMISDSHTLLMLSDAPSFFLINIFFMCLVLFSVSSLLLDFRQNTSSSEHLAVCASSFRWFFFPRLHQDTLLICCVESISLLFLNLGGFFWEIQSREIEKKKSFYKYFLLCAMNRTHRYTD